MAMQIYTIEQEILDNKNYGFERGREEGIELGQELERMKMVKELLSVDISLQDISRVSKISIEELLKIKEILDLDAKK